MSKERKIEEVTTKTIFNADRSIAITMDVSVSLGEFYDFLYSLNTSLIKAMEQETKKQKIDNE